MNSYQKSLIEEDSQLVCRIIKLHDYLYNGTKDSNGHTANDDDRIEFANKCIQLAAMKKYEEALSARLENAGIVCEEGTYFEKVASICESAQCDKGSDFDADCKVNSTNEQ